LIIHRLSHRHQVIVKTNQTHSDNRHDGNNGNDYFVQNFSPPLQAPLE
jgi:hypothetical protein